MGSNLGDRRGRLRAAVDALAGGGLIGDGPAGVVAVSPVYETEPVGGPPGQPVYLNVVVELSTTLGPRQLLEVAHRLEGDAGRVRAERFGPRTLDVDILLVGDEQVDEPDLVVPHPRMWERRFVLAPLSDLAPELVPIELLAVATGDVRVIGRLEGNERHPPGPEREESQ